MKSRIRISLLMLFILLASALAFNSTISAQIIPTPIPTNPDPIPTTPTPVPLNPDLNPIILVDPSACAQAPFVFGCRVVLACDDKERVKWNMGDGSAPFFSDTGFNYTYERCGEFTITNDVGYKHTVNISGTCCSNSNSGGGSNEGGSNDDCKTRFIDDNWAKIKFGPNPACVRLNGTVLRWKVISEYGDGIDHYNADRIEIKIHAADGKFIRTLVFTDPSHPTSIGWNLTKASGHVVKPGIYFASVTLSNKCLCKKRTFKTIKIKVVDCT